MGSEDGWTNQPHFSSVVVGAIVIGLLIILGILFLPVLGFVAVCILVFVLVVLAAWAVLWLLGSLARGPSMMKKGRSGQAEEVDVVSTKRKSRSVIVDDE
jgi:membrane protein implicated in regulation of membrane protease activity